MLLQGVQHLLVDVVAGDDLERAEPPREPRPQRRLRVLEQNINSHGKLSDEDKVNLQQYITRCYGSLTTFNVLFDRKEDWFVGEKKG